MNDEKWRLHERRPRKRGIEEMKKYSDDLTELFRNKIGEDFDLIMFLKSRGITTDRKPYLVVLKSNFDNKDIAFKVFYNREEADELLMAMNSSMSAYVLGIITKEQARAEVEGMMK